MIPPPVVIPTGTSVSVIFARCHSDWNERKRVEWSESHQEEHNIDKRYARLRLSPSLGMTISLLCRIDQAIATRQSLIPARDSHATLRSAQNDRKEENGSAQNDSGRVLSLRSACYSQCLSLRGAIATWQSLAYAPINNIRKKRLLDKKEAFFVQIDCFL